MITTQTLQNLNGTTGQNLSFEFLVKFVTMIKKITSTTTAYYNFKT